MDVADCGPLVHGRWRVRQAVAIKDAGEVEEGLLQASLRLRGRQRRGRDGPVQRPALFPQDT